MRRILPCVCLALVHLSGGAWAQFYDPVTGRDPFGHTAADHAARDQAEELAKANRLKEQELKQSGSGYLTPLAIIGVGLAIAGAIAQKKK